MNNLEFMKFDSLFGEKYVGIATIRYEKRFIFRFKMVPKEGGGFYAQPAAYKLSRDGKDIYVGAFQLDSSYEFDEMKDFVVQNVTRHFNKAPQQSLSSASQQSQTLTGQAGSNYQQNSNDNLPF